MNLIEKFDIFNIELLLKNIKTKMDPFIAYLLIKNLEKEKINMKLNNLKNNNLEQDTNKNKTIINCSRCGQYPIWCRCVLK